MKFSLATLYVRDIDKSLAFYNGLLGLPILRRQPMGPGRELVFLGEEGMPSLELIPTGEAVGHAGFSVGFAVEDLAAAKEKLAAHGYPLKREMRPAPGVWLCFFTGPDGEEVELMGG